MIWQDLLAKNDVRVHQTSKQEIDNIKALIRRDLADAALTGNTIDYDSASVASDTEAHELMQKTYAFYRLVEDWLTHNYANL